MIVESSGASSRATLGKNRPSSRRARGIITYQKACSVPSDVLCHLLACTRGSRRRAAGGASPGATRACRRGERGRAARRLGQPVFASTKRLYHVFSLGTGRTDFFLSSVHRLVSVCILRLCMHPVTSPVTAPAASVARHGTQVPHTHTQPQPHADRRHSSHTASCARVRGPGGRGGAGRARGGGPGARPLTSRCCCVS